MENLIYNDILKNRNGFYVHALEVESVDEIKECINTIGSEFENLGTDVIKEFFNSMSIYYIGDDDEIETEVYDFNIDSYIDETF